MTVFYPTASTTSHATMGAGIAVSNMPSGRSRHDIPGAIPADELFFWTRRWQEGEAESERARKAGEAREFATGRDAVRWLLSDDD